MKLNAIFVALCIFNFLNLKSQVGIGTTTPDPSSLLEITSSNKGMLTPRMSTIQRNAINSPAEGLLVYDTDLDAFYFYDTTNMSWIQLGSTTKRDNYVLVKSESDFPAPVAGVITLDTNVLYEINGLITLSSSIDLNGAYLIGLDSNEDVLLSIGGTIFTGSAGGSIRNVTLTAPGGVVFNLNNISGSENLVMQSTIIANSGNIGTIQGYNLVFMNIIQFSGNTTGITYSNVNDLLLNNLGWFGNNGGVYETFIGAFSLIEKVSGFSKVIGAAAAMDVTGITSISEDAVLESVVFSGGGNYINGNSPYIGYNFTNDWTVNCPGIPEETDKVATGYIYFNSENNITTNITTDNVPVKMEGITTAGEFFRMDDDGGTNNRIKYVGDKPRAFTVTCSATVERSSNGSRNVYSLIIFKNGNLIPSIISEQTFENGVSKGNFNLLGALTLASNDYIEVYVSTDNKNIDPTVKRFNLVIN
ncbi:hypothetical protein KXJ69_11920 [Aureisphaera sp. CAU 1614]|uniref:Cell wall anchor protein n=1 Tax=Halomarinibacterium sedimenti TaxID=2857106 RepID=A0A9X1FRM4_9FLAO|nr:hypothetical protein [Halomarinibacterium sedimenti]MBW2938819.1 hypothetical protein [Halomarinibacterium sedimenti]